MDHAQEHCGKGIDVLCIGDKRYNPLFSSNLLQLLNQVSYQVPDRTALAAKRNGQWVKWTFAEYEEQVMCILRKIVIVQFKFQLAFLREQVDKIHVE